ncbi:MAG TPA: hypothetical protein DF383_04860 [Deltaproteobacteria bacterium]|nr:hypothetical protein [Deltaproteobacteria bacterium]
MKILSAAQVLRLDRLSIKKHGIAARDLMRRAAEACYRHLTASPHWNSAASTAIVCGPGNNGGDGFALAARLEAEGHRSRIFFLGDPEKLSAEAKFFYEQVRVTRIQKDDIALFRRALNAAEILVDALFGIGLNRPLGGIYAQAIAAMNRSRAFKLAVDMPSGISAEDGTVLGTAFRADLTVTFETPKWGQILPPAWDYVGELRVESIGLNAGELRKLSSRAEWIDEAMVRKYFQRRPRGTHKGRAGRALVVAGSRGMPGAGYLSSLAALRVGAGLVTWMLPEDAYRKIDLQVPEVILAPAPSVAGTFGPKAASLLLKKSKRFQSIALGPGLGRSESVHEFLRAVLPRLRGPLVMDADALDPPAQGEKILIPRGAILTPHLKEMARLIGMSVARILEKPFAVARSFARRHRVWLLLKGYRSILASPEGKLFVNSTGGPNLATAGSGDVLTGILVGLLAQGFSKKEAVLSAVFLHGLAGDRWARLHGDRGTIASDLVKILPELIGEWIL